MSVNLSSLDQILVEAAERLEDLTPDLTPAGADGVVKSSLEAVAVSAMMSTFAMSATMTLALRLNSIHLPHDTACHWSHCDQVSQVVGVMLAEFRAACAEARSQVLAAVAQIRRGGSVR